MSDPYACYYYRFIATNRTTLEHGLDQQMWAKIEQHLLEFIGTHAIEELCRE